MRTALLIAAALLAFAAGAAARLPLSAALALSGARDAGLDWRAAEGTIWSGRVYGLGLHGYALGDAHAALAPLSLVTLSPRVTLGLAGPEAEAQATVTLRPGYLSLRDGAARLRLAEMVAIDPRLRARGGTLTAEDVEIVMQDGRCVRASGALASDALTYGFGGDWRGPPLSGALSCADGALAMHLAGRDETQEIEAEALLGGGYSVEARVHSQDPDLARIAPLIGFTEYGEGWRYQWSFAP